MILKCPLKNFFRMTPYLAWPNSFFYLMDGGSDKTDNQNDILAKSTQWDKKSIEFITDGNLFSLSSGVIPWAIERANKCSGAREQCGASEWVSSVSERRIKLPHILRVYFIVFKPTFWKRLILGPLPPFPLLLLLKCSHSISSCPHEFGTGWHSQLLPPPLSCIPGFWKQKRLAVIAASR